MSEVITKNNYPMTFEDIWTNYCVMSEKWSVYVSLDSDNYYDNYIAEDRDILKRSSNGRIYLPIVNRFYNEGDIQMSNVIRQGYGTFFFDDEDECREFFEDMEHDDAEFPIYAMICNPDGEIITENT